MNVIIRETGETEVLGIIDPASKTDYISDFIGNTGALDDGQFEWDEDQDAFVCDQDTFDWWERVAAAHEELEDRIFNLVQIHGRKAVYKVVMENSSVDLEDQPAAVNQALDEAFGE